MGKKPETAMNSTAAAMWQQVHDGLKAFIIKRVGNEAETEDLLQEIFLKVHRDIVNLKKPDRMISWIYQIARHVIIDYYRMAKRRREISGGLALDLDGSVDDVHTTADLDTRAELAGCVQPMLARLPAQYRDAVRLVEIEGLTHRQAARQLGLSVSGMKSRVQRGRRQLKDMLEACCLIELDLRGAVSHFEPRRPCR